MWLRGSAPINRHGFSYQFGGGLDSLALPGFQNYRSFGFHFGLGYYPSRTFGILAHTRLQFSDEPLGAFYNVRLGMEAQWYPISLWRLHLGPFVGGGQSWSASAGAAMPTTSGARPYVSAGALAELEISTRLGLTFRFTEDWLPTAGPDTPRFVNSWSVGLAVSEAGLRREQVEAGIRQLLHPPDVTLFQGHQVHVQRAGDVRIPGSSALERMYLPPSSFFVQPTSIAGGSGSSQMRRAPLNFASASAVVSYDSAMLSSVSPSETLRDELARNFPTPSSPAARLPHRLHGRKDPGLHEPTSPSASRRRGTRSPSRAPA